MTMTGRFVGRGICILAAAVLLLAVVFSPARFSRAPRTLTPPNSPPRDVAILKSGHGVQFAVLARPFLREADSLQADTEDELDADIEVEDELTLASPPASVSFDVLPSPCPQLYSKPVSFTVALATRPLLC